MPGACASGTQGGPGCVGFSAEGRMLCRVRSAQKTAGRWCGTRVKRTTASLAAGAILPSPMCVCTCTTRSRHEPLNLARWADCLHNSCMQPLRIPSMPVLQALTPFDSIVFEALPTNPSGPAVLTHIYRCGPWPHLDHACTKCFLQALRGTKHQSSLASQPAVCQGTRLCELVLGDVDGPSVLGVLRSLAWLPIRQPWVQSRPLQGERCAAPCLTRIQLAEGAVQCMPASPLCTYGGTPPNVNLLPKGQCHTSPRF